MQVNATTLRTSVKAGLVIMLYNLVESTITMSLTRIHDVMKARNVKFDELNSDLKKMLVVYYNYSIEKKNDVHKSFDHIMEFIGHIKGNLVFDVSYKSLSDMYPLYSGNLDSREIKSVLSKYGMEISNAASELRSIKKWRNELAHGEKSFEEVGRDLTVQQLDVYCERTFTYLESVIDEISAFLENEKFKAET